MSAPTSERGATPGEQAPCKWRGNPPCPCCSESTEPRQYRKRPVVIEAMEYTVESCRALHDWVGYEHASHDLDCDLGIYIDTLEGQMTVSLGDFVIKGVQGEFYPCKPDIFAATYEPVEAPTPGRPS